MAGKVLVCDIPREPRTGNGGALPSATAPPPLSLRSWQPLARHSPHHPWVREVWRWRGQGIASHAHPATYLPGVVAPATAEIMAAMLSTRALSTLKTLHLASFRHDREDSSSSRQAPSPPPPGAHHVPILVPVSQHLRTLHAANCKVGLTSSKVFSTRSWYTGGKGPRLLDRSARPTLL